MESKSNRAVQRLVSVLAPPRCAICGRSCGATDTVCAGCALELRAARSGTASTPDLDRVVWTAPYEGVARALVAALKFGGRLALADFAAEAIAAALDASPSAFTAPTVCGDVGVRADAIVPVPPAPLRRRRRGFDPAELIGARLAARLELPVCACLGRADHRRQVGKARAERLARPPRIGVRSGVPARTLLVDDVLTTGATLAACARALRGAGGERVEAAVLARSL
jgi:ComF family protein